MKAEALKLVRTEDVNAAASQLGLHASQLYGWRSKAALLKSRGQIDQGMARENARLSRELAEKKQEFAFLGKAAAHFAKGRK